MSDSFGDTILDFRRFQPIDFNFRECEMTILDSRTRGTIPKIRALTRVSDVFGRVLF